MNSIETLQKWIDESKTIVFFLGAGVSTESGLKDFRSVDGLYHMNYTYPPEQILSHSFFLKHPDIFFDFYKKYLNALEIKPNLCHEYLVKLEKKGKLKAIVTQNIDGLHTKAGSSCVFELHGSIYRNYCISCGKSYSASYVFSSSGIPRCSCGGIIKPDVVLYEEPLDDKVVRGAIQAIQEADLFIVAGTSLTVYPAASFLHYFKGRHLVIINRDKTSFDEQADLVLHESLGDVFAKLN
ncbi:MAG TPA: NAD-dependent protein deacylase [Candidatus Onthousia faecigallinarum]|nr:NAD-dependent protein deacylase [Candidatus Onthousia faecigallinarum]